MKTVLAALAASFVTLGVVALVAPSATVGDGRADHLSTYVTGQSVNAGPSTSDYVSNGQSPSAPVVDDAAQHRMQLGR